jgi:hypothetical protein
VLLSYGNEAYGKYGKKTGITHARCRVHCGRGYFQACGVVPQAAAEAQRPVGALYKIEPHIREHELSGEATRLHWLAHSKPLVE